MKNWQMFYMTLVAIGVSAIVGASIPWQDHGTALAQTSPEQAAQKQPKAGQPSENQPLQNGGTANSTIPSGVMYTAKFECGSIFAGEGPLRPGHYDTDISLFNKERYESTVLWNVVVSNGPTSNAMLVNLGSENVTSITCQDIRRTLDNYDENFLEGFVVMNVPFDSALQPSKGTTISSSNYDSNPLVVQVFYTANALDTLPHEVVVDKISFYIIQDYTGKIPKNMLRTTLDVSIPSTLNQLSNTENTVKQVLARQYNLTSNDLQKVVVRISSINVGVGVLIDDHAISLSTVSPQLTP